MKIIVSPTKSMKRKQLSLTKSQPYFIKESETLRLMLQKKTKEELKTLYKTSDKVVETAYSYFHEEHEPIHALALYDGLVFKQLKLENYRELELEYLEEHVIIMSALYGALKGSDLISEYRLDYLMKFDINLYEFWEASLTEYFKEDELIVNLASSEFSTAFQHPNMVNVNFVNASGKTQSTAAKMARGDMLDYLVSEQILDLEGIKKYNNLRYHYDEKQSSETELFFVMEEV